MMYTCVDLCMTFIVIVMKKPHLDRVIAITLLLCGYYKIQGTPITVLPKTGFTLHSSRNKPINSNKKHHRLKRTCQFSSKVYNYIGCSILFNFKVPEAAAVRAKCNV